MDKHLALYLVAIQPPKDLGKKIHQEREVFSKNFHCQAALKPPVHITIDTPFKVDEELMEDNVERLQSFFSTQARFELGLKNYGFFENPDHPVVYIDVIKDPLLKQLNTATTKELKRLFNLVSNARGSYHPHFTIGYRDVPPDIFPDVKRTYGRKQFTGRFDVHCVSLFKHNQVRWELFKEFPLGGDTTKQLGLFD